jgi:type IX secretion system PorP/SprF family membrane protein
MRILLLSFVLLITQLANAQQMPLYSQYIFNGLVINPAYAGSKSVTNANATYRSQWMNIDGAPTTQTLSIDGSPQKQNGYGFQMENDQLGAQGQLTLLGTYAYRISLTEQSRISFGISGGASRSAVNKAMLTTVDPNDPLVQNLAEKRWRPDARFGVFYNTDRYYAGVSVANLLADVTAKDNFINVYRNYFFNTGYLFTLNEKVKLKPGIMVRENFHTPTNIDFNAFVLLDDRLWLGSSFRTGVGFFHPNLSHDLVRRDAMIMAAEYYINDSFRVGYSYDFDVAGLRSYNTHEISLGYYLMKKKDAPMVSPRYF